MTENRRSPTISTQLLFDEPPLVVSPSLAGAVGIDAAHFLQQIHYWLQRSTKIRDGRRWVYKTYEEWQQEFPWMSTTTLSRLSKRLEKDDLLITGCYNEMRRDRTRWYTINYEQLNKLTHSAKMQDATRQNARCNSPNCHVATCQNGGLQSTTLEGPLPETTTETTTETNQGPDFAKTQNAAPFEETKIEKASKRRTKTSVNTTPISKRRKEPDPRANEVFKAIETVYGDIPHPAKQMKEITGMLRNRDPVDIVECWKWKWQQRKGNWVELAYVATDIADWKAGRLPGQKGNGNARSDTRTMGDSAQRGQTAGAPRNVTREIADDWSEERELAARFDSRVS